MDTSLDIWILQTGEPLHCDGDDPRPMRAMNLANSLVSRGHNVTVFSSAFNHTTKTHRSRQYQEVVISERLNICLIPSPGYLDHKGLMRLIDHFVMAIRLRRILNRLQSKPNAIFIGYPPIEVAYVMSNWARANAIPYVADVKDQWPHLFVEALPKFLRWLGRIILSPYFVIGSKTLRGANSLSAMAGEFLIWSQKFARRDPTPLDRVFPLSAPKTESSAEQKQLAKSFWLEKKITPGGNKVVFAGTITGSFDMGPVLEAARHFREIAQAGGISCDFIFCGVGPYLEDWKTLFAGLENVHFPGWVEKVELEVLLTWSLAVLVPLRSIPNYTGNIPNKVVDGLANGKPILSGLRGTLEKLIKTRGVGLHYDDSETTLTDCITKLIEDKKSLRDIEENCKEVYRESYDFEHVYKSFVSHLELIAK
ncbi:MAG: glycosyltransferase [Pseudomonadota bacterium]|nr:glycosyltransferase [Pseudomonadota bacterium]